MESILFITLFLIAFSRPAIGIVLLLNIYLIKPLILLDANSIGYDADFALGSNLLLGAILPAFTLIVIFFKKLYIKKYRYSYPFDKFEMLILSLSLILLVYVPVSPVSSHSLSYFLKFLFLGISYYFVVKFILFNSNNPRYILKMIFLAFYYFGIVISIISLLIMFSQNIVLKRLTLPGIHPIPFAQAIGISFLFSFAIFISNGKLLALTNKLVIKFNVAIFIYLFIVLLFTNTRGILLAVALSSLILLLYNPYRLEKIKFYFISFFVLILSSYLISNIGIDVLFHRLMNSANDASVSDRLLAYNDSVNLFFNHPFGVGTGAFGYFSDFGYPHNLFLQNISEYGIFGLLWSIAFIFILCSTLFYFFRLRKIEPLSILALMMVIFYFTESMFSFTLWMQKGLFLSLGLLSYLYAIKRKIRS